MALKHLFLAECISENSHFINNSYFFPSQKWLKLHIVNRKLALTIAINKAFFRYPDKLFNLKKQIIYT